MIVYRQPPPPQQLGFLDFEANPLPWLAGGIAIGLVLGTVMGWKVAWSLI